MSNQRPLGKTLHDLMAENGGSMTFGPQGNGGGSTPRSNATREPRERHERPPVPRLGDRIGSALESLGVTPERWSEAKEAIGLPAGCNCAERKAWFNRLDERLGLGEKLGALQAILRKPPPPR